MTTTPAANEIFRGQETLGRWVGLLIFGGMTARTASQIPGEGEPTLAFVRWGLVTALFALFTLAYLRRPKARALASRPIEILLPLVVAALPLVQDGPPSVVLRAIAGDAALPAFLRTMLSPIGQVHEIPGLALMAVGEAFAVVAMFWLGRSFSLFVEVRELVTAGPYRLVRHPVYLGELVGIWGYALLWSSPWSLSMAAAITALQAWRARIEERKLLAHLPAYAAYRERTGFLLPRLSALRAIEGGEAPQG